MSLAALRKFADKRRPAIERCELCGLALGAEHPHLVETVKRTMLCACDACAVLFCHSAGMKYRRIPRDTVNLPDFQMSDSQWEKFEIPIGVAFFFKNSAANKIVSFYPSPAGAVESLLPLDAWEGLVKVNPILLEFEPDVEALLVNRMKNARTYFRAPVDECYRLAGLIRIHWRGFSGGTEVWEAFDRFFAELNAKGRPSK